MRPAWTTAGSRSWRAGRRKRDRTSPAIARRCFEAATGPRSRGRRSGADGERTDQTRSELQPRFVRRLGQPSAGAGRSPRAGRAAARTLSLADPVGSRSSAATTSAPGSTFVRIPGCDHLRNGEDTRSTSTSPTRIRCDARPYDVKPRRRSRPHHLSLHRRKVSRWACRRGQGQPLEMLKSSRHPLDARPART